MNAGTRCSRWQIVLLATKHAHSAYKVRHHRRSKALLNVPVGRKLCHPNSIQSASNQMSWLVDILT